MDALENKIEYPTFREMCLRKKRKVRRTAAAVISLFAGALLLRAVLAGRLLPDGALLEALAQTVQSGGLSVEDAVVAFCREMITDGPA